MIFMPVIVPTPYGDALLIARDIAEDNSKVTMHYVHPDFVFKVEVTPDNENECIAYVISTTVRNSDSMSLADNMNTFIADAFKDMQGDNDLHIIETDIGNLTCTCTGMPDVDARIKAKVEAEGGTLLEGRTYIQTFAFLGDGSKLTGDAPRIHINYLIVEIDDTTQIKVIIAVGEHEDVPELTKGSLHCIVEPTLNALNKVIKNASTNA